MTRQRQNLGERGERVAELWLTTNGWTVLDRRFRSGHRDIDIVAQKSNAGGRLVAFVEVKTRHSASFGGPLAAVNWRKQRELRRSAQVWIARFARPSDFYRFDVIGVLIDAGRVRVRHIENAFAIPSRY